MNAAILLRQKVLDLAIRGKLTKREKGDDSIRKILDQVSFEKAERIAKKRNRKEKLLPPVSQEERPFEVPFEWEWRRLGEVLLPTETKLPVGKWFDYIDIDAIDNHQNVIVRAKHLETRDAPSRASRGVQFGDVLFSVVRPYLRNIVLVGKEFSHCIASTGFHVCRPSAALDSRFLFDVMLSDYVVDGLNAFMKGDNSPSINVDHIVNFPIPIPPLAEQKRIVERIDELFAAIDQYSAAMGKISEAAGILEKKVVDLAIRGKLTRREKNDEPAASLLARITAERQRRNDVTKSRKQDAQLPVTDEEKAFDLPEGWVWCRLGDVFQHNTGKALNRGNQSGVMRKYLTTSNVYWDEFKLDNLKQMAFTKDELDKCTIERGDLLVCEGGDIGRAAIWDRDEKMCIQNHLHRLRPYIDVCVPYFCYVLRLYKVTNRLQGKGIGLLGFSSSMVHDLIIPLPPLAEQKRIVERVDAILAECRKVSR